VIAPTLVLRYSHGEAEIERTLEAVDGAQGVYRKAVDDGNTDRFLEGPPSKLVFRRYA
jgi:glutamate-1-semialdehyde 2,1-aminomutase